MTSCMTSQEVVVSKMPVNLLQSATFQVIISEYCANAFVALKMKMNRTIEGGPGYA
jgi:hypothetical protein